MASINKIKNRSKSILEDSREATVICPHCNIENDSRLDFCDACGWPLRESLQKSLDTVDVMDKKAARGSLLTKFLMITCFIIFALSAFFIYQLARPKTLKKAPIVNSDNSAPSITGTIENNYTEEESEELTEEITEDNLETTELEDEFYESIPTSEVTLETPIMGDSQSTAEQFVEFYENDSPIEFPKFYKDRGVDLEKFAEIYIEECKEEDVRADVAFVQMAHETGFLNYGGNITIGQFNFAGLGIIDNASLARLGPDLNDLIGDDFSVFGDNENGIRMGIRAQIQHLKAYASDEQLINECVDPRFQYVIRDSAPTLGELSKTWSEDPNYSAHLLYYLERIDSVDSNDEN